MSHRTVTLFSAGLLLAEPARALADVHYVDVNSTNATPPYTDWASAATKIQDAVDAAVADDAILVTNGTYAAGGRTVDGATTNRVAINKPLVLRSVNGALSTIIDGGNLYRCLYLTNGASVSGFTLIHGRAAGGGGGLFCESTNAVVSNCVVSGNSSFVHYDYLPHPPCCERVDYGASAGGVYGGTLNNCILKYNYAETATVLGPHCDIINCATVGDSLYTQYRIPGLGGGARDAVLNNCAVTSNSAGYGGGAYGCTLNNCTLTFNAATATSIVDLDFDCGAGVYGCTANNCIIYFNLAQQGTNYDASSTLNYCCTTPALSNGRGNISDDPQLASASYLSATSPCRGAGNSAFASGTDFDGEPWASPPSIGCDEYHAGAVTGPLTVAIAASFTNVPIRFVQQLRALIDGRASASSWDFGDGTMATNRPDISHAWGAPGDYPLVLSAFNESHPGGISATVTVHVVSALYVAANNSNPQPPYTSWATAATSLQDALDAAPEMGKVEVVVSNGVYASGSRATYNGDNRIVVDKPLTVRSVNGAQFTVIDGGHSNRCVFLTDGATLSGFTLINGVADYGGGAHGNGTLNNCQLIGNSASQGGGGAAISTMNNCCLRGNSAWRGGGALGGMLNNCTLTGNLASDSGGGVFNATLNDCIVYLNAAASGANYDDYSALNYCCTTPLPTNGTGNITSDPMFVDAANVDFHLQSTSPCINTGNNAYVATSTDLGGNPRILADAVDIGAYEFQSISLIGFSVFSSQAEFDITGQSNQVVIVETSADLVNWSPVATNTVGAHPFRFSETTPASLHQRFYRAQTQ